MRVCAQTTANLKPIHVGLKINYRHIHTLQMQGVLSKA